jgi:hypothetical protein
VIRRKEKEERRKEKGISSWQQEDGSQKSEVIGLL